MSEMTFPELAIIVLNYKTPDLVKQCLESLVGERETCRFRVIVVDNDSQDGSAEKLAALIQDQNWSDWIQLVSTPSNLGFAGGNNYGLGLVTGIETILLLNSDTIVHRGCLARCLNVLKANPQIGALSCKLLNGDGSIQNVCRKFPNPLYQTLSAMGLSYRWPRIFGWANIQDLGWDRDQLCRKVDWLGGAFLMVPQRVLRQLGLLDDDFFFYGEDVEFCHRVTRAGYYCWYEATVSTTHLGAGSSDVTRMPKTSQNAHRWKARYLEQRKMYGRVAEYWLRFVDACMRTARGVRGKSSGT